MNFELTSNTGRFFNLDIVSGTIADEDAREFESAMDKAIAQQLVGSYVADILSAYPALSFDLAQMYAVDMAEILEMTPSAIYHSNGYEVVSGPTQ